MKRYRKLSIIACLLVAAGFVLGLGRLFALRFETGDVYPIYSSMRADPLGTRAFYESLQATDRFQVQRNFGPLRRTGAERYFTLFCLTASPASFAFHSRDFLQNLHRLALNGARIILTARAPQQSNGPVPPGKKDASGTDCDENRSRSPARADGDRTEPDKPPTDPGDIFRSKWQAAIACSEKADFSHTAYLDPSAFQGGLPPTIPWHSGCYFTGLSTAWRVIYAAGERPLVIERTLGQGKLILMSDTFPLSNEALRDERLPGLLAWLAGPHPLVVFEETHLGLHRRPGVAALARRTGLLWPLAAAVLVVLLFVWKNAMPFVPPPDTESAAPAGRPKDYTEGLISLLHRSVSRNRILETMVAQWLKDLPPSRKISEARRARIRTLAAGTSGRAKVDPVAGYHHIYQLISEKSDEK